MPWEAFLQILKRMFDMCNWKSAPYTVAKHWATKSVMHYRDPARGSWFKDEVLPASEFKTDVGAVAAQSQLVRGLLTLPGEPPESLRFLKSVSRGPEEVRLGDWVLLEQVGARVMVGCVDQMIQVSFKDEANSFIRMWCSQCKEVHEEPATLALWSAPGLSGSCMLVKFERMQVWVVSRSTNGVRDELVYIDLIKLYSFTECCTPSKTVLIFYYTCHYTLCIDFCHYTPNKV
jgi:hypothetical protein